MQNSSRNFYRRFCNVSLSPIPKPIQNSSVTSSNESSSNSVNNVSQEVTTKYETTQFEPELPFVQRQNNNLNIVSLIIIIIDKLYSDI